MKAQWLLVAVAALFLSMAAGAEDPKPGEGELKLSGPYTQGDPTGYLIHGKDKLPGKTYLTLQEAMEQKKVIVHETSNVNELAVENVSTTDEVYIQSGDIVKGGRQDRAIATDFILPRKSGKIPVDSFCVEQGRWRQRGGESSALFASSGAQVSGKHMKMAANSNFSGGGQGQVWKEVQQYQTKASSNAGTDVTQNASPSSLQLTLENKKVKEEVDQYVKKLQGSVDGKNDVIGMAFAINGQMNSVEIYGNHTLFMKMWPKLLNSAGAEAFAELEKNKKFEPAKEADVMTCLRKAEDGKSSAKDVNARTRAVSRESKDAVMFETFDKSAAEPVHRSVLTRDPESPQQEVRPIPNQELQIQGQNQQAQPQRKSKSRR
jgi:hypothetical protein